MDQQDERKALQDEILTEAPRLGLQDRFRFTCRPGVTCFTDCCADLNIVLTPYDILRLERRLGMDSTSFLDRHTISPFTKDQKFPVRMLKMDGDDKRCAFLGEGSTGCTVYEDRPWSCRMYPLGKASPQAGAAGPGTLEFFFLMKEDHCKGFDEAEQEWTVASWMEGQGVLQYERFGDQFKQIVVDGIEKSGMEMSPKKMEMFHQAFYDLDDFRRFVFESPFLKRIDVDPATVEAIRKDDEALLDFSHRWLKLALFADMQALSINKDMLEAKREDLRRVGKLKE